MERVAVELGQSELSHPDRVRSSIGDRWLSPGGDVHIHSPIRWVDRYTETYPGRLSSDGGGAAHHHCAGRRDIKGFRAAHGGIRRAGDGRRAAEDALLALGWSYSGFGRLFCAATFMRAFRYPDTTTPPFQVDFLGGG